MTQQTGGSPSTTTTGPTTDRPRVLRDDLDVSYGLSAGTEPGWQRALQDPEPALRYLLCFLTARDWVHRRVDTLAFSGVAHVAQHTSLDLTVPLTPPSYRLRSGLGVIVLPVAQVAKDPLTDFDLTSGEGHHLPLLTQEQNDTVATLGMLQLANIVLARAGWPGRRPLLHDFTRDGYAINDDRATSLELPDWPKLAGGPCAAYAETQRALVRLITGSAEEGEAWLHRFECAPARTPLADLWAQLTFRTFLRRLAGNRFVAATLPAGCNDRRVITYSLERRRTATPLRDAGGLSRELVRNGLERLGLLPLSVLTDVSAAQDCASYHLEVQTPEGLKITDLDWFICPPTGDDPDGAEASRRIVDDLGPAPIGVSPDLRDGHEHDRVHTRIAQVPLGYTLTCRLRLAPAAGGWLLPAGPATVLAAALQAVILTTDAAGRGAPGDAYRQNQMTLALGVAALVGTVLLSWGGNPLPRRLLLFPRLATVTVLVTLLVSGLHLVGAGPPPGVSVALLALAALSALSVLGSELVALGPLRTGRRSLARLLGRPDTCYWKAWSPMEVPQVLGRERPARLSGFRPEATARSSRMVISTVEGPRFVSSDFRDGDQLLADARELFAGAADDLEPHLRP